jgi:hypothetical protein
MDKIICHCIEDTPKRSCVPSIMWRGSKEATTYESGSRLHEKSNLPVPWSWTYRTTELYEVDSFCLLVTQSLVFLLQQAEYTKAIAKFDFLIFYLIFFTENALYFSFLYFTYCVLLVYMHWVRKNYLNLYSLKHLCNTGISLTSVTWIWIIFARL